MSKRLIPLLLCITAAIFCYDQNDKPLLSQSSGSHIRTSVGSSPPPYRVHGGSVHIELSCRPRLAGVAPMGFLRYIPNSGQPESASDWIDLPYQDLVSPS